MARPYIFQEGVSTCLKCGVLLCEKNFCINGAGKAPNSVKCKACVYGNNSCKIIYSPEIRLIVNQNANKIHQKLYDKRHPGKKRQITRKWHKNNPERVRELKLKRIRKDIELLRPTYLKTIISISTGLSFSDIPDELVNLQRKQLKLKRYVKKQKNNNL